MTTMMEAELLRGGKKTPKPDSFEFPEVIWHAGAINFSQAEGKATVICLLCFLHLCVNGEKLCINVYFRAVRTFIFQCAPKSVSATGKR